MPSYGQPFLAFVAWVIPISFLLTWLWLGTRSAWLATVMHGTMNLGAAIISPLTEPAELFMFSAIGMTVVAAGLVVTSWSRLTTRPLPARDVAASPSLVARETRT